MRSTLVPAALSLAASVMTPATAEASPAEDRRIVAALDTEFQAAVKHNDAKTMDRILHDDMILVLGDGRVVSKAEQLQAARENAILYEIQDEDSGTQVVRVWGDTAVVTARLRIKGTKDGAPVDRSLWFSDTYVRTPQGWKYYFGQASLRLPDPPAKSP